MIAEQATQMARLAETLHGRGVATDLTEFPSGGAILDAHTEDGRFFVMAYSPTEGYCVDEVGKDEGFTRGYRFVDADFARAAEELRRLVEGKDCADDPAAGVALNLVVVYAGDVQATVRFYETLGLQFRPEQHGHGPRHYAAQVNGATLEVYARSAKTTAGAARGGFRVANLDSTLRSLRSRDAVILSEPRSSPWGRRAVVEDPAGNRVELSEATTKDADVAEPEDSVA